jgi:hypothetical protein
MKRRLTLAIGCLACAMPSIASVISPNAGRTTQSASTEARAESRRVTFIGATQIAQTELELRELADAHSIASVVYLKGAETGSGHYDVRIEPPAALADGVRLRGFSVGIDGSIVPATDFRAVPASTLSTQPSCPLLPEKGLGSAPREG